MARKIDPESVSSKVSKLIVGQHEIFDNPYGYGFKFKKKRRT